MSPDPDDLTPDDLTADEQAILADLAVVLGADPVPNGLIERAEGLVAWFDVDTELVALLEEPDKELVGTRGGSATGLIFVTSDRSTELEVELGSGRVVGHLVAGDAVVASLVRADGSEAARAEIDDLGRFELVTDETGPHRLGVVNSSGVTINTDWFVL